ISTFLRRDAPPCPTRFAAHAGAFARLAFLRDRLKTHWEAFFKKQATNESPMGSPEFQHSFAVMRRLARLVLPPMPGLLPGLAEART
ncbi:MAG: hypothetical protein LBC18_12765, partial [Opitutaceae bacterium]|nr:hypothetical protein [Opitutaceae bacterium]